MLGRTCILNVFAGGVLLRFLAAASTFSLALSRGDCLSWRKAFSSMRVCMSIGVIVCDFIEPSLPGCGLGCFSAGYCENAGGDLVTPLLAGADEFIGIIRFVGTVAVVRPKAGIGVKILESADKKLRPSSWLSVPSMCLWVSALF